MRLKSIRSLRELTRILDIDQRIRRLCLIRLTRGLPEVSPQSLHPQSRGRDAEANRRGEGHNAPRRSGVAEVDVVLDAAFVKAWSIRDPNDSRSGFGR